MAPPSFVDASANFVGSEHSNDYLPLCAISGLPVVHDFQVPEGIAIGVFRSHILQKI